MVNHICIDCGLGDFRPRHLKSRVDEERISKEDDAVNCLGNADAWGWKGNYICRDFDLGMSGLIIQMQGGFDKSI